MIVKTQQTVISVDVANQFWFYGALKLIKAKLCSLAKAVAYTEEKASAGNHAAAKMLRCVFRSLVNCSNNGTLCIKVCAGDWRCEVVFAISFVKL